MKPFVAKGSTSWLRVAALLSVALQPGLPEPLMASPAVALTSPEDGSTVSTTINLRAGAADDPGVSGVQFLLDGGPLGPEDTSAPYEVPWDTRTAPDGPHALAARARDAAGDAATSDRVMVTVANGEVPSVTLGRSEETAVTPTPAGAWAETGSDAAGVRLSGDRAIYAAEAGAMAGLAFTGTGVRWIGFPCEICGTADVLIDDARVATVDTYAPARPASSRVMYTSPRLAPGSHTLAIEVSGTSNTASGGAYVVVDAFEATLDGSPGAPARYEETAATWAPDSVWTRTSNDKVEVDMSGGWAVDTAVPGATVTFLFNGTGVRWIGFPCELCGVANVLVDGARVATVDTYAPARPNASKVMYTSPRLSPGGHSVAIEVTGTANPSSGGAYVVVDAFEPTVDTVLPFPVRFEETAATLAPEASWTATTSAGVGVTLDGDRAVFASEAGATASLQFFGTEVRWIGFPCELCGSADVLIDGMRLATVDTYAPARPAGSSVMYASPRLSPGSHSLTIEVTGSANEVSAGTYVVVDAFEPALDGPTGARVLYEVTPGAPPPSACARTAPRGRFRSLETTEALSPAGAWTEATSEFIGATLSRDRGVFSMEPGATAALPFVGTGIRLLGVPCGLCGIVDVLIDGVRVESLDTYAPTLPVASKLLYTSPPLEPGCHTLALEVTGTANAASTGAYIILDGIEPIFDDRAE